MILASTLAALSLLGLSDQEFEDYRSWPARFDDDEPTPEETLVLYFVNEFRSDPPGFARRIRANPKSLGVEFRFPIDWDMFERECADLEPRPPLVHDLRLAKPARSHSLYTIANDHWGHEEREGGTFYTGRWPMDRLKAAGVTFSAGENTGTGRPDPWSIVAGLVLDAGPGGTGGMQKSRGHHRSLHQGRATVAAAGIVRGKHLSPFTFYVGRLEGRFLGGVVFVDRDRDGKYDVGKGLDGVEILAEEGALGTTWSSGGYGFRLSETPGQKVVFRYRSLEIEAKLERGSSNVRIDADFAEPLQEACEALLELVEKLTAKEKQVPDKLLYDLMFLARGTPLSPTLQARLATCTRVIGASWEVKTQLLDGLEARALEAIDVADVRASKEVLKELRRAMRKAPQIEWFEFAFEICEAEAKLRKMKAGEKRVHEAESLRRSLLPRAADPRFRSRVRNLGTGAAGD